MFFLAELRRELDSDEGSTADEGAHPRSAGFSGRGAPMAIRLAISSTGSRQHPRVGRHQKIASTLRRKVGKE